MDEQSTMQTMSYDDSPWDAFGGVYMCSKMHSSQISSDSSI